MKRILSFILILGVAMTSSFTSAPVENTKDNWVYNLNSPKPFGNVTIKELHMSYAGGSYYDYWFEYPSSVDARTITVQVLWYKPGLGGGWKNFVDLISAPANSTSIQGTRAFSTYPTGSWWSSWDAVIN